jgi:hypothetical protein
MAIEPTPDSNNPSPSTIEMDYIWNKLPKQRAPDGSEYIEYTASDLPYLYHHGFVDTQRYSLDDWLVAIIPFKHEESGTYRLTQAQFLTLDKYRYGGMIRAPFSRSSAC